MVEVLVDAATEGTESAYEAQVKAGEQGTVVAVLRSPTGHVAYEVECVSDDGRTSWQRSFDRSELKFIPPS